jgi:hypothetical protein
MTVWQNGLGSVAPSIAKILSLDRDANGTPLELSFRNPSLLQTL